MFNKIELAKTLDELLVSLEFEVDNFSEVLEAFEGLIEAHDGDIDAAVESFKSFLSSTTGGVGKYDLPEDAFTEAFDEREMFCEDESPYSGSYHYVTNESERIAMS